MAIPHFEENFYSMYTPFPTQTPSNLRAKCVVSQYPRESLVSLTMSRYGQFKQLSISDRVLETCQTNCTNQVMISTFQHKRLDRATQLIEHFNYPGSFSINPL